MPYTKTRNDSSPKDTAKANREKRIVAISSVAAAVLLVVMKLVVGVYTNSLGILSEALHSGLDFVAASITLWAVHMSSQPADREHTYGHGKFENLSAFLETLLLLATCGWIVYEAGRRLLGVEDVVVRANAWAFGVVIVSIVIDFFALAGLGSGCQKVPQPGAGSRCPAFFHRYSLFIRGTAGPGGRSPGHCARPAMVGKCRCRGRLGRSPDCDLGQHPPGPTGY